MRCAALLVTVLFLMIGYTTFSIINALAMTPPNTVNNVAIKTNASQYYQGTHSNDNNTENKLILSTGLYSSTNVYTEEHYSNEANTAKLVIESCDKAESLDIRTKSNWGYDDFNAILNDEIKGLIPVVLKMERELGVNAVFLMAVGITETGWGRHMAGNNNYYNWSYNGKDYIDFESIGEFTEFSMNSYSKNYMSNENYTKRLGYTPTVITPAVVNCKYAFTSEGVNTKWSQVVTKVMLMLSNRRIKSMA